LGAERRAVITRAEARALGLTRFFTGKPCSRGGVDVRSVANGQCLCENCRSTDAARQREAYGRNREKASARNAAYYQANRDRIIERAHQWATSNPEKARKKRADYAARNPASVRAKDRRWREANKDRIATYARRWDERNRDRRREIERRWRERNPDKVSAKVAVQNGHRRAAKANAVPPWFGEWDQFVIEEAHAAARRRTAASGFAWSVDHMIPLRARTASGLHVWNNIQVIPAEVNSVKCNRLIYTEPLQWLDFYDGR
jgi:hypothetical protein